MSLKAKLEAVIYAAEEPVTLTQLAALFAADALDWKAEQAAAAAELAVYEQLQFVPEGQGPELIDSGFTALGGVLPVNTSGGLLSAGELPGPARRRKSGSHCPCCPKASNIWGWKIRPQCMPTVPRKPLPLSPPPSPWRRQARLTRHRRQLQRQSPSHQIENQVPLKILNLSRRQPRELRKLRRPPLSMLKPRPGAWPANATAR